MPNLTVNSSPVEYFLPIILDAAITEYQPPHTFTLEAGIHTVELATLVVAPPIWGCIPTFSVVSWSDAGGNLSNVGLLTIDLQADMEVTANIRTGQYCFIPYGLILLGGAAALTIAVAWKKGWLSG